MPMMRASLCWCTACETTLTGLLKFTSHASGASRAVSAAVLDHRRDGADRHREAGRADRLLADHAVRDRRRLVVRALGGAAGADAGDDEVGAVDARLRRGMRVHRDAARPCGRPDRRSPPAAADRCRRGRCDRRASVERANPPASSGTRTPAPPMMASFTTVLRDRVAARARDRAGHGAEAGDASRREAGRVDACGARLSGAAALAAQRPGAARRGRPRPAWRPRRRCCRWPGTPPGPSRAARPTGNRR